jgi:hypothetical protein
MRRFCAVRYAVVLRCRDGRSLESNRMGDRRIVLNRIETGRSEKTRPACAT